MKKPADIIIRADHVLTMDGELTVVKDGAIAVHGTTIAAVGGADVIEAQYTAPLRLGGPGTAAFPGLVNAHTHSPMVFFRGLADDLPLKSWLEDHIWPAEKEWLSPEFVADAVRLACLEMMKSGVTFFNDMYFHGDTIASTASGIGMRSVVGAGILEFPTSTGNNASDYLEQADRFITKWKDADLVTPCVAPHSPYACTPATLRKAKALSEKHGAPLHIHLSETEWEVQQMLAQHRARPVTFLDSLGFLDRSVTAAHCVWVEEGEIEVLAGRGVGVVHCIESNLKLAAGFAPVVPMLAAGVRVVFGTDGAASNNDLDILSEMSTAARVHKALSKDPTALGSRQALLMATRWAAEAFGLGRTTGSLEAGKAADIVIADMHRPHLLPLYDIYSQIVYSMNAADISTVLVNGRPILKDRVPLTLDQEEVMRKAVQWGRKIRG